MPEINFTLNGEQVSCEKDEMLLQVALDRDIDVPHLCYHEAEPPYGACRLCLVEITKRGSSWVEASCTFPVRDEGIEVKTETEEITRLRRMNMELLLARCPGSEKVRQMAEEMGVEKSRIPEDGENACVLCGLCVEVCRDEVGVGGISFTGRGPKRRVAAPYDEPPQECIGCMACAEVCPTGHISVEDSGEERRIEPFGVKQKLVRCPECGHGYVTEQQLEYLKKKLPEKSEVLAGCPVCKGRRRAEELKRIFEVLDRNQQEVS